jgi:hypothetical protein
VSVGSNTISDTCGDATASLLVGWSAATSTNDRERVQMN